MDFATDAFRRMWIDSHGPPGIGSADPEFGPLELCGTKFESRLDRRHNKIGVLESTRNSLRLFVQRLVKDTERFKVFHGIKFHSFPFCQKANFLCNVLRGNPKLSRFELARGYHPSISGLPQTAVSKEIFDAHKEQMATRAISRMLFLKTPAVVK